MTKPLFEVQSRPRQIKGQPKDSIIEHSKYSADKNKHYHARILGGDQRRAIDELNPTETIPAHRQYPGLANGE